MSGIILRIMGFLSILSGLPSQGNWLEASLAGLLRLLCLLFWTAICTFLLVSWTNSLIKPESVREQLESMVNTDFAALEEDLRGKLFLSLLEAPDGDAFAVRVALDSVERMPPPKQVCAAEIERDTLCLYRVRHVLSEPLEWLANHTFLPEGLRSWWIFTPFEKIEFPSTAYSISEVALEIASEHSDNSFTRSKEDQIRAAIEQEMENNAIFLPTKSKVLLARQLNGPIQFLVFALGFWSIGIMLFLALGSLLPNAIVRMFNQVELSDAEARDVPWLDPQQPGNQAQIDEDVQNIVEGGATPNTGNELGAPDQAVQKIESYILLSPTPWNRRFSLDSAIDLTDEHQIARYYEAVSTYFRSHSSVLGTVIDPPILRFRTAATRAVANTGDTSILPSFLDAQRSSIDGYYDARLSIVKFLLWVIPTIGFIGTIIGVSDALSATIGLQAARDLISATSQSQISASMGTAFDTTLVALIAAVVVMLLYYSLQGSEERMTVLERNSAEDEVLRVSKFIRKPGDEIDLAQQLIFLGVNTEVLVRDLKLFQKIGPDLARTIDELRQRKEDLTTIVEERRNKGMKRSPWSWLWLSIVLLLGLYILASNGVLAPIIHQLWPH